MDVVEIKHVGCLSMASSPVRGDIQSVPLKLEVPKVWGRPHMNFISQQKSVVCSRAPGIWRHRRIL